MRRAKRAPTKPRTRRKPAARASRGAANRPTQPRVVGPSLAELRRRATERLRGIARLRAVIEREHLAAEEICDRLRAARPTEVVAWGPRVGLAEEDGEPSAGAEEGARPRVRLGALQSKLRAAHAALEAAESRNRGLQRRLLALEAQRLEPDGSGTRQGGGLGASRAEVAALQAELRRARAGSDGLRENMTSLLGFLDELSGILSPSEETAESTPDS